MQAMSESLVRSCISRRVCCARAHRGAGIALHGGALPAAAQARSIVGIKFFTDRIGMLLDLTNFPIPGESISAKVVLIKPIPLFEYCAIRTENIHCRHREGKRTMRQRSPRGSGLASAFEKKRSYCKGFWH